jgi:hypothetical protein
VSPIFYLSCSILHSKGHFTHETENPGPYHFTFKHSHWWKRRSRSKFASHYAWGTNGVYKWMQDGCKVYMAPNGSCFMVTWIVFKNHLLDVGLTQNWHPEHSQSVVYSILSYVKTPHEYKFIEFLFIWLRTRSHMTSLHTWGSVITLHDVGMAFGTLSFGLSQSHGHGSWLVCEVALTS